MHHREGVTDMQHNMCTPSKEEVLRSIPWPSNVPTRDALLAICQEMEKWKCFADKLQISKARQTAIERNNPDDFDEQKFQVLRWWKQQQGREANWKVLISACIDLEDHHLTDKAIALCKQSLHYSQLFLFININVLFSSAL